MSRGLLTANFTLGENDFRRKAFPRFAEDAMQQVSNQHPFTQSSVNDKTCPARTYTHTHTYTHVCIFMCIYLYACTHICEAECQQEVQHGSYTIRMLY